jgi:hypothetical protein
MLFKKREKYKFSGRRHSRLGIISFIIGIAAVLGLSAVCTFASTTAGNAGLMVGFLGFLIFAFAIFGFVLGYKACKQRDIFYRFPIAGIIINGAITISLVLIYVLGL